MHHLHLSVTGNATHHFFVMDAVLSLPILTDPDGTILVFLDRFQAEEETRRRLGKGITVCIVGMGDNRWELFQKEEKYRIVPRKEIHS